MPVMAQTFDVCIRGAGIVGRTLALLLARERLRVALVAPAQSRPQHKDVRAYALNISSRAVLQSLRCWPDDEDATPVTAMQVFGDLEKLSLLMDTQTDSVGLALMDAELPTRIRRRRRDTPKAF